MYRTLPDFDTMVSMHRRDPAELEKVRQDLTRELMDGASASSRHRLEGLQFRIDMELRRAKTPMARCLKMSSMMHDSLLELDEALHDFQNLTGSGPSSLHEEAGQASGFRHSKAGAEADILNFPIRPGGHSRGN